MRKTVSFIIFIIFASSLLLNQFTGFITFNTIPEEQGEIQVFFCPQDNCEQELINSIKQAENIIHCAFFDLNLESIIDLLQEKKEDGLQVQVVIDNNNRDKLNQPYYIFDTSSQYSHNKFCIIDEKTVITGSTNPTINGVTKNNNNLLIINSKYLAENYEDEFTELRKRQFGKGGATPYPTILFNTYTLKNHFCPEDNCKDIIIQEINKAEESIYFMTFSFTHPEIAQAIQEKDNLDVKGVFEKRQNSKYSQIKPLNNTFGTMQWDNNKYTMHHKVFIIDKKTVITGSMNPSKNADENNDENIIIITEPQIVTKFLEEFQRITE